MFGELLVIMLVNAGFYAPGGDHRQAFGAAAQSDAAGDVRSRSLKDRQQKYNSIFPINTPDEILEPLLEEVGVWDADVELYVGDAAKQPIRKTGVQTNRLVSKGRYMLNDFRYIDGSYEGTGLWGWDAYDNRYSGIWMDGDHYLVRHDVGYYDRTSKTMHWEADTLQTDGVTTRLRITQRFAGATRTFQMDRMDASTGTFTKLIFMKFTKRAD